MAQRVPGGSGAVGARGEALHEIQDIGDGATLADPADDRRAHHRTVSNARDRLGGVRAGDAEADDDGQRGRGLDSRDFGGDLEALQRVLLARPNVLNHNTETVPSLYRRVRSRGVYARCLEVLA